MSMFLLLNCTDKRIASKSEIKILPPEELYGQLFYDVMSRDELFGKDKLFNDSKDFVDCIPQYEIETILEKYSRLENKSTVENIRGFLKENFIVPEYESSFTDSSDIHQHIFKLWSFLKKEPDIKNQER